MYTDTQPHSQTFPCVLQRIYERGVATVIDMGVPWSVSRTDLLTLCLG